MLNVLSSKGVTPGAPVPSGGGNEFMDIRQMGDYVPDLGFGLDGDRSFRYNDMYYPNNPGVPMDSNNSTTTTSSSNGGVEDYSEFFKGSSYGCFNTEDYGNLVDYVPSNTSSVGNPLSVPPPLPLPSLPPTSNSFPPAPQGSYQPSPAVLFHIDDMMKGISLSMSFTDVTLVAQSQLIHAHKSILASHSTFLRQILIHNGLDIAESEDSLILLPNVKYIHVQMMVSFLYTGQVTIAERDNVLPLRELCTSLGVSSLTGRLDELTLSLNQAYESSSIMLDSTPDLDPLDSVTADLPHLSNTEIDSVYLNGGDPSPSSLQQQQPPPLPQSQADTVEKEQSSSVNVSCSQSTLRTTDVEPMTEIQSAPTVLVTGKAADSQNNLVSSNSDLNNSLEVIEGRVKKKAFSCTRCQSKFYTQESLHVHESLHEERKPFSCNVCGKSIASKGNLAVHLRIHSGEKPFTCDKCNKSFMDGSSLKRHKYTHENRKTHECDICSKVFGDRSTYRRHYKEKHLEGSKKYTCHLCQKLFHRKETLNAHFVKVHSLSPDEIFDRDKAREIENSKKWKTYNCSVCNMMFSKQSTMEIHLRTHTGDKPYVCEVCGKKFTRSNNLKLHKRVHTGEKPYQCSQCDKRFSDVSAHKRHLRTHTGEKPYQCSKCKKGFIQIGAKNVHEKGCTLARKEDHLYLAPGTSKTKDSLCNQQHTVPGTLYLPQEQQQSYNSLMDDSSLTSIESHSDLHSINTI